MSLRNLGKGSCFYAKHAKMCLILIIGVNYVSAFITSAPLFLTCCVEPPEAWQGRVAGGGGTLAFPSLREEDQDCSALSWPREVLVEVRHYPRAPEERAGMCSDRRWARSWPGTGIQELLLISPNCNFCFVGFLSGSLSCHFLTDA